MNAPRSGCPINLTLEALGDRWVGACVTHPRRNSRRLPRIHGSKTAVFGAGVTIRTVSGDVVALGCFDCRRGLSGAVSLVRRECRRAEATEVQIPRFPFARHSLCVGRYPFLGRVETMCSTMCLASRPTPPNSAELSE